MPIYNPSAGGGGGGAGSFSGNVVAKTSTYAATADDDVILASGTFTITLYASSGNSGEILFIKNTSTGTISVDANSTELIDGSQVIYLAGVQFQSVQLCCDGTGWQIL